jgi:hypothetical protein
MVTAYDLRLDEDSVRAMQRVSRDPEYAHGLAPEPLIGSEAWWRAAELGALETADVRGTIARAFWSGMADFAEIEVRPDDGGAAFTLAPDGDVRLYVPGIAIRIRSVRHPWKRATLALGDASWVTSLVELAANDRRSEWVAPGPAGMGYELRREEGQSLLHFFVADDEAAAGGAVAALEAQLPEVSARPIPGTTRHHVSGGEAAGELTAAGVDALRDAVAATGARYDGSELVGVRTWGPAGTVTEIPPEKG